MVQQTMVLIFQKHNTWVDIVSTFGCDKNLAEDIVMEMYIKIQLKLEVGLDIMYEDEINYYYIFKTLKSLFLDLMRKKKGITIIHLDNLKFKDNRETGRKEARYSIFDKYYSFDIESDIDIKESYDLVKKELNNMFWYDRKVFEIINGGESIAEFSRKSYIKYFSLYNTYKKVKEKLRKLII